MDKLVLAIALPMWWIIVVTDSLPAMLSLENTNPLANTITLGMVLVGAWLSELHRTGRLPSLRRGNPEAEYAVEFDDGISGVWEDDDA